MTVTDAGLSSAGRHLRAEHRARGPSQAAAAGGSLGQRSPSSSPRGASSAAGPGRYAALVFLPAALSAIGFLQARHHTCVLRAAQGTFELEDSSTTPAPAAEVAASRQLSHRIVRDTILIGLLAAVLSAATTLLR